MKRDDLQLFFTAEPAARGGPAGSPNALRLGPAAGIERRLVRCLLAVLGDPPLQILLWNGDSVSTGTEPPTVSARMSPRTSPS